MMTVKQAHKMTRSEAIAFLRAHGKILPEKKVMVLAVRMALMAMYV